MSIKPILYNTEMVLAIRDDRKTATRRTVKQSVWEDFVCEGGRVISFFDKKRNIMESPLYKAPYQPGDILYVRETWAFAACINCNGDYRRKGEPVNCYDYQAVEYDDGDSISDGCFLYKAGCENPERITWRPSIHMPKQAARIWLRVTDVRVERLQDITISEVLKEGCTNLWINEAHPMLLKDISGNKNVFTDLWNSTIKKTDIEKCGWDANPWVWVIEFERCEKPEVDDA